MVEVAQYGTATVKRAYGDWTTPQLGSWKEVLHVHSIQPVQQFRYTCGKNQSARVGRRLAGPPVQLNQHARTPARS